MVPVVLHRCDEGPPLLRPPPRGRRVEDGRTRNVARRKPVPQVGRPARGIGFPPRLPPAQPRGGAVTRDDWKGYLRRDIETLQLALREDLRLVSWGVSRTSGEYALWLDCQRVGERSGTAAVWRGRAPLPRTWARSARDAIYRRGLLLALAQALADIACRSGAGVGLWRDAGNDSPGLAGFIDRSQTALGTAFFKSQHIDI